MRLRTLTVIIGALFAVTIGSYHVYGQTPGSIQRIPETSGCPTSGATGIDILCSNSADHALTMILNNGSRLNIPQTFYTTTTYTNATTTLANLTGLSFPVNASRNYHAICNVTWSTTNNTGGPKYAWTGPGGAYSALTASVLSPVTVASFATATVTTYSSAMANTGTVTAGLTFTDVISFSVMNSAGTSGTVQLQFAANGVGTLTALPASNCIVQ